MKKVAVLLASILAALFSCITFSEAQTMTNKGLNARQESIVTIAAFTANGDLQKLKTALSEGLDAGLTINEIKEVLVQMYAYAGFPRSLNGINTFINVLEERGEKGIKDLPGKEPSSLPANRSSIERGAEIQTRLIGAPATGAYITFTPAIDEFLKGHLFGDIFGRDNLDFQSRELATIAALANIEGVNPQLQAHFNVGLNTGLTETQLRGLTSALESKVGRKQADNANEILAQVLSSRQALQRISITRSGSQPSIQGSPENFTGSVRIDPLFLKAHEPSRTTGGRVTFEPGARTAWHSHPLGQTLIVTAGTGLIQQRGGPIEEIRQGDVIWIPPNQVHWHGAAPGSSMTHIAIQEGQEGKTADWKGQVSDEQYNGKQ
ncbi:(R)-mandelonitrile lyase [Geomonas edaphica]|uniref:(R)-mandelonitrile lyase n=1 Tax=Geomonas edaphica TaxID=2570226 RepID=UPI0010A887A1|nr:carboxymuconolactone decarboxylase family protein [Geomonas edaphica]